MSDWRMRNARALLREFQTHGLAAGLRLRSYRGEDLRGQAFDFDDVPAESDFAGSDLTDARFADGVDLHDVDFSACMLVRTSLNRASLRGANLRFARLDGASLIGADLRGAKFEGTTWRRARLIGALVDSEMIKQIEVSSEGYAAPNAWPQLQIAPAKSPVTALAWSSDCSMLAVATTDNSIGIWSVLGQAELLTLTAANTRTIGRIDDVRDFGRRVGQPWEVSSDGQVVAEVNVSPRVSVLEWAPTGLMLASGDDYGRLSVWDATSGTRVLTTHPGQLMALNWSADSSLLAVGSADGAILIWEIATETLVCRLNDSSHVSALRWSRDGRSLASGSADGTVRIYEVSSGKCTITTRGQDSRIEFLLWTVDGRRLSSFASDGSVCEWDADSGIAFAPEVRERNRTSAGVRTASWSLNGSLRATGDADGAVRLVDRGTRRAIETLRGHSSSVTSLAWAPDGSRLASGDAGGVVRLWDVTSGGLSQVLSGHTSRTMSLRWSPTGPLLANGSADGVVRVWDASTGNVTQTLVGHSDQVMSLAWQARGLLLASGDGAGNLCVWDAANGVRLKKISSGAGAILALEWSPNGGCIASGDETGTVGLWDSTSGSLIAKLDVHAKYVTALGWSPTGTQLASGYLDGTVRVWDSPTGVLTQTLNGHGGVVTCLDWSADGTLLKSTAGGKAHVFRIRQRTLPASLPGRSDSYEDSSRQQSLEHASAIPCTDGSIVVRGSDGRSMRFLCLPKLGWATIYETDRSYRLVGDPAGMFWWSSGLCRFEPGELDGFGIERKPLES